MRTNPRHAVLPAFGAALLILCAPQLARAQVAQAPAAEPRAESPKESGPARARKIDEFGRLYGCDGGARLDNFAYFLSEEPGATGYIMAYDAPNRAPLTAHFWGELLRQYLIEYGGIEESRVRLVDAGRRAGDDMSIEFWLVPPGAEPPEAPPAGGKKAARPFAGKFDQFFAFDGAQFYDHEGGSAGSYNIGITYAAFRELLRRQPESQGYVVVYARRESYPGYWRNVATREQQKLTAEGVGGERLTVIRGGVNEGEVKGFQGDPEADRTEQFDRVELWVGGKDKPPVKHRPEKETLREAVMVAEVAGYWADRDEINRWALDNLNVLLRANAQSTACLVVYPESEPGSYMDSDGQERQTPDLFGRAEAIKAELRRRGVDETRLVLMNGPVQDYSARLELWAVPYGAALPDPFAKEGADVESEDSESEKPEPGGSGPGR